MNQMKIICPALKTSQRRIFDITWSGKVNAYNKHMCFESGFDG
jgi:hypothetical protein